MLIRNGVQERMERDFGFWHEVSSQLSGEIASLTLPDCGIFQQDDAM